MFFSFQPLADKTNNKHLPKPFFKDKRKSLYQFRFRFIKKIVFAACHSGKLKPAFTSPDVISTSSKNFLYSNSSKNITRPSGKLKTEFTSPITKSNSPGLSDTTFFPRWPKRVFIMHYPRRLGKALYMD